MSPARFFSVEFLHGARPFASLSVPAFLSFGDGCSEFPAVMHEKHIKRTSALASTLVQHDEGVSVLRFCSIRCISVCAISHHMEHGVVRMIHAYVHVSGCIYHIIQVSYMSRTRVLVWAEMSRS